ncbi:ABC transporter ATP-binding protein [Negadavirga shengliensis]|uniref:ABC transporter ATP-binding protein n=1 Tax=Negadavirga shengliensis TaxID=1389218 RepID=A0ABV9SV02_9BACT
MSYLEIKGLYKRFDKEAVALEDFSLQIDKGERLGVVGESGSGKSTLLKVIAGLEIQDSGEVYLAGDKVLNPAKKLVPGYDEIQLVRQDYGLYPNSTVEENIRRPLLQYNKGYAHERVEFLLETFGMKHLRNRYPRELSGGQQQKVAIARALSLEPEVLLLDEPFSSLDPMQKRELMEELALTFREIRVTVLLVTHDLQDALWLTDKLCVMNKGRALRIGSPMEIYESPENAYVAGLFSHLNPIPGTFSDFIRPTAVRLDKKDGKFSGRVALRKFFPQYNLLAIKFNDMDLIWQVEDYTRNYALNEQVFLDWKKSHIIQLHN